MARAIELIPAKQAEVTQTTQYTATNVTAVVSLMTATNVGGAAATITVNIVSGGGAATAGNIVVNSRQIAAGETYTFPEMAGQVLANGSFISTLATGSIVLRASGAEITN